MVLKQNTQVERMQQRMKPKTPRTNKRPIKGKKTNSRIENGKMEHFTQVGQERKEV